MKIIINKQNTISYISIEEKLYSGNISIFEKEWDRITGSNPEIIAINFIKIIYIDSTAIGSLVQFSKILRSKNIKLVLFNLSKEVETVFNSTGLKIYFTISTSEELNMLK